MVWQVVMNGNPYESPRAVEVIDQESPGGLHAIGIGFLGGAFVGGTAGAAQGAVIAAIIMFTRFVELRLTVIDAVVVAFMAATIVGALFGALVGCVVGPLVGGAAQLFGPSSKRFLNVLGVTTSTFGSVIISVFAVRFATGATVELSTMRYAVAVFSAILTGFVGGVVLVRGMIRLIWPAEESDSRHASGGSEARG